MHIAVIAPFWNNPNHVGIYRVDRFIRWLHAQGHRVTVISSGQGEAVRKHDWGDEIVVPDWLNRPVVYGATQHHPWIIRQLVRVVRFLLYAFFVPDQTIVWAWRVSHHPVVRERMKEIDLLVSSNPPESVHVATYRLSKKYHIPMVVDMRDGWLDEPLKPILEHVWLRNRIESVIEHRVMRSAGHVLVTSRVWQENLLTRYPFLADRISVLTNGYPPLFEQLMQQTHSPKDSITVMHAGQFTASHMKRNVDLLMAPFAHGIQDPSSTTRGELVLLGFLSAAEQLRIQYWDGTIRSAGWTIRHRTYLPREEMLKEMRRVDGLVLLEVKKAGIPSKIFEYIPTGKPVLAFAMPGSAVWDICEPIPQIFLVDYTSQDSSQYASIRSFLEACRTGNYSCTVPQEYTEDRLSKIFIAAVNSAHSLRP